jgi:hypothetical protein
MNTLELFGEIKDTFCSLWKYKVRGETIEIITPYTTPNAKFVSVFITQRNDSYIVTDGGWLLGGEYYDTDNIDNKSFNSLLKYFEAFYELRAIDHYGTKMFYNSTKQPEMVPNKVHDLSQFISQTVTSYASANPDLEKNLKDVENFRVEVDSYIKGIVNPESLSKQHFVSKDYESIRFNAIITYGKEFSLVKYVTGSTFDHFRSSITKASADFQIINSSPFNIAIRNRIAVLNDSAPGFEVKKSQLYVKLLEEHLHRSVTLWSQRDRLLKLL